MHTYLTYVLLPSGYHPVKESLVDADLRFDNLEAAKAESRRLARQLYPSHVTKTIILQFT